MSRRQMISITKKTFKRDCVKKDVLLEVSAIHLHCNVTQDRKRGVFFSKYELYYELMLLFHTENDYFLIALNRIFDGFFFLLLMQYFGMMQADELRPNKI